VSAGLEHARAVADAVLYEGYLLYPYRASSTKNRCRWQFGVLGPPGAVEAGTGEEPAMAVQFLVQPDAQHTGELATITARLRFLQLQRRSVRQLRPDGSAVEVAELRVDGKSWLSWDEAVEHDLDLGTWDLAELAAGRRRAVSIPGGSEDEGVATADGIEVARLVRTRRELRADVQLTAEDLGAASRIGIRVENVTVADTGREAALASSFVGAHLLFESTGGAFVSMTDPPNELGELAAGCAQLRCWPVLAGPEGDRSVLLASPIILYDHPELAQQSAGALFDSTEIDEILTLRILTLTDDEKAAARATDARAAEIIDRCEAMSPSEMRQLHGVLLDSERNTGSEVDLTRTHGFGDEAPWWDPAVDASVSPETDSVVIAGVPVAAGSIVAVHPNRRADAQDLFFEGQLARVTAVHSDVDGEIHVAVVLLDDPAADLHEWYGRYLYFAPDELTPTSPRTALPASASAAQPEGSRP
jgi:hypothetical protein